jgi:hypothetical protein
MPIRLSDLEKIVLIGVKKGIFHLLPEFQSAFAYLKTKQ